MSMAYKPYEIWYPKGLLSGILVYFLLLFFRFLKIIIRDVPFVESLVLEKFLVNV